MFPIGLSVPKLDTVLIFQFLFSLELFQQTLMIYLLPALPSISSKQAALLPPNNGGGETDSTCLHWIWKVYLIHSTIQWEDITGKVVIQPQTPPDH